MKSLRILPRKTVEDYVRVRTISPGDEEFLHEECYKAYYNRRPSLRRNVLGTVDGRNWKQLLVNNYLKYLKCKKCLVKLQCSCSPFKATDPGETKCTHGDD